MIAKCAKIRYKRIVCMYECEYERRKKWTVLEY